MLCKESAMHHTSSPLPLVDAHAHLYAEAFNDDLGDVIERATARGVQAVLTVSETVDEAHRILALAERYPLIKPCAGLYPTILDRGAAAEMLAFIRAHRDRLVAIGEVGLDYWKVQDEADREVQRDILAQQIALARALELPLNVHSRSAGRHTIAWLREHGAQRVPRERLLLESDSPVLGPDKEQRNEPQNVWLSCLHIAAIKGVPVEAVAH